MQSLDQLVLWLTEKEAALSALAAIAVIAGIGYGALRYLFAPLVHRTSGISANFISSGSSAMGETEPPRPLNDKHNSLAILLFDALSKNDDDEFLASGITSEVIAHVTMVPNIRVCSRVSAYRFRSGQVDIQKVAEQLNTSFILTGSLRRADERIRVIAQLTDMESDTEIWAHTYDRELDDLFDVQHDIAKCIVGAVLGEVKLAETLFANTSPEHQLDAWGLVQKAYHFWLTTFTPQGILEACKYLRQAIEIDPEYASARAALAMLLAQQMTARICEDYDACAEEARELIEMAYQQAPNDIDVLENAGVVWQNLGEKKRATLALRRVVEIAPLNLISRGYLALLLALTGGDDGARECLQIVRENFATAPKHPSAPYWNFFLAIAEQRLGNNEKAVELAKQSLIGQPGWVHNYFIMANAYCLADDREAANVAIENAATINPYLTTQFYADNVYRIVGDESGSEPFVGGLKKHRLID